MNNGQSEKNVLLTEMKKKKRDWSFWYFIYQSSSNTMFLIVILGGLASTVSGLAGDLIKFGDPKFVSGVAGAAVVAAKLTEDGLKLRKNAEKYERRKDGAEGIIFAMSSANIVIKDKDQETELDKELVKLRQRFLSLFGEYADGGGDGNNDSGTSS